jgi:hypothetical protein
VIVKLAGRLIISVEGGRSHVAEHARARSLDELAGHLAVQHVTQVVTVPAPRQVGQQPSSPISALGGGS